MSSRNRLASQVLLVATLVILGATAFAAEDLVRSEATSVSTQPSEDVATPEPDQVTVEYLEKTRAVVVALPDTDGIATDCSGLSVERSSDGELTVDGEVPDGCLIVAGEGPNGKITHGSVVSSVATSLKAHDLDIPRGQVIREVATLKPGGRGDAHGLNDRDDLPPGLDKKDDLPPGLDKKDRTPPGQEKKSP